MTLPHGFDMRTTHGGVFDALIEASERFGAARLILEDQERKPLTYRDLIRASFALGRRLCRMTGPAEHVGLFLPTSAGAVVTFFALQAFGRVPTMLNFTSGARNLKGAVEVAGVRTVLTSRRFIAQARRYGVELLSAVAVDSVKESTDGLEVTLTPGVSIGTRIIDCCR